MLEAMEAPGSSLARDLWHRSDVVGGCAKVSEALLTE